MRIRSVRIAAWMRISSDSIHVLIYPANKADNELNAGRSCQHIVLILLDRGSLICFIAEDNRGSALFNYYIHT
jgi:hypothetical protein